MGIKDARAGSLGRQVRETSVSDIATTGAGDRLQTGDIIFNGVNVRETTAADDSLSTSFAAASAISKAAAINDATEFTGVRAIVEETIVVGTADIGAVTLDSTTNLTINGSLITGFRVEANDATDTLVNAINAVSDDTGVVASLNEQNRLELSADDGRNIEVVMVGAAIGGLAGGAGSFVTGGRLTLQSEEQFSLTGAVGAATKLGFGAAQQLFGVNSNAAVSTIDITSRAGANEAIDIADVALKQVSGIRAKLGATQNRLESTINNLSVASENVSAARSRIIDADFAVETADFSRNQIIQQAGISVLAQANQQPQIALALLA